MAQGRIARAFGYHRWVAFWLSTPNYHGYVDCREEYKRANIINGTAGKDISNTRRDPLGSIYFKFQETGVLLKEWAETQKVRL